MVDAAEGVLGLEWIDGKTVRILLPGGAEEEDQAENGTPDLPGDATLTEFGVTRGSYLGGLTSNLLRTTRFRYSHGYDWRRDSKDASCGHHSWRSYNLEYDASQGNQ